VKEMALDQQLDRAASDRPPVEILHLAREEQPASPARNEGQKDSSQGHRGSQGLE
jgi:hypothetical protein